MEDTVKMVHKDNPKQTVEVRNQIQRDAFLKQGFVDAPTKNKEGNLPADVAEEQKTDTKVDVKKGNA